MAPVSAAVAAGVNGSFGVTILGWAGWWLGAKAGIMTAWLVSGAASIVGAWLG